MPGKSSGKFNAIEKVIANLIVNDKANADPKSVLTYLECPLTQRQA